jgi:hypothetical protein
MTIESSMKFAADNRRAWASAPSGSQHLNAVGGDDTEVSGPGPIRFDKRAYERLKFAGAAG